VVNVEPIYDLPPLLDEELFSPPPTAWQPDDNSYYGNVEYTQGDDLNAAFSPRQPEDSNGYYGNMSYPEEAVPTSPIPAVVYRAKYSFSATNDEELSFMQGDLLSGASNAEDSISQNGWIRVKLKEFEGWAPLEYLQPISSEESAGGSNSDAGNEVLEVQYEWNGTQENHLSLVKGEVIRLLKKGEGWWMGEKDGKIGWFPAKFVKVYPRRQRNPTESSTTLTSDDESNKYKADYTFPGDQDGDLPFMEGDIITVLKKEGEWWVGEIHGKQGLFPSTYVSPLSVPSPQEIPSITSTVEDEVGVASGGINKQTRIIGRVIVGFIAQEENQLGLVPGQLVLIRRQEPNGWWEGQLQSRGVQRKWGWFPSNRITLLKPGAASPLLPSSPLPPTGGLVLALYSYQSTSADELSFHKGSVISVISKDEGDWWKGELNGKVGLFPSNYVQPLDSLKSSEAAKWSDMVKPEILEKIPPTKRKRQEAIYELIQSEKSYVHSLNLVKEVFFIPMENSHVLTELERRQVFVNWEELIECNSSFLKYEYRYNYNNHYYFVC
jgi:hypothetical protein